MKIKHYPWIVKAIFPGDIYRIGEISVDYAG